MAINQKQVLSLQQKLSPQQIQMIKLLGVAHRAARTAYQTGDRGQYRAGGRGSCCRGRGTAPADFGRRVFALKTTPLPINSTHQQLLEGRQAAPGLPDRGTVVAGVPDRAARVPQPFRARDDTGRIPGREHRRGRLPAPRPGVRGRRHRLHGSGSRPRAEELEKLLGSHPRTGTRRHRRRAICRSACCCKWRRSLSHSRPRRLARKILTAYFDEFVEEALRKTDVAPAGLRGRFPRGHRRDQAPVAQARQPLLPTGGTDTTPYIIPDFILDYQDGHFRAVAQFV